MSKLYVLSVRVGRSVPVVTAFNLKKQAEAQWRKELNRQLGPGETVRLRLDSPWGTRKKTLRTMPNSSSSFRAPWRLPPRTGLVGLALFAVVAVVVLWLFTGLGQTY